MDKEGDIGPEVRASGFEREHEVTLETWNAQRPAEFDGSVAEDSVSSSAPGSDSDAADAEGELLGRSRISKATAPDQKAVPGDFKS